jgi:hypothetical protein
MVSFDLKQTIKTLVLAPAAAGLAGFTTYLVATDSSALPNAVITAANAPLYAAVVGVIVFAVILVADIDKMITSN